MRILPTMNRADQCQDVLDHMVECNVSTPGLVVVNGPLQLEEYRQIRLPPKWGIVFLPENIGVCGALNYAFNLCPNEPWYSLACDDEFVFTPNFDTVLAEAAGDWFCSNANDGWKSRHRMWSFVTIGGKLARELGGVALPGLFHWYWDNWLEEITQTLRLKRWCSQIKAEHRHVVNRKSSDDLTYQIGRSRSDQDRRRFEEWKSKEWPSLAERLKQVIPESRV